jgi:hypothetical protein
MKLPQRDRSQRLNRAYQPRIAVHDDDAVAEGVAGSVLP